MRAEIDASAAQLDLRMTEGDAISFNFLVKDAASWGGVAFECHVKETQQVGATALADLTVVATTEGADCDFLITGAPVPALTASHHTYFWDMQDAGGITRFAGHFYVEKQVTGA